jgi:hypothetical protein
VCDAWCRCSSSFSAVAAAVMKLQAECVAFDDDDDDDDDDDADDDDDDNDDNDDL